MTKIQDIRNRTKRTNGTRALSRITTIVRHHSATTDGNFDSFWRYWNGTRGWGTGGYHEIILRDGTVQLCYDPNEITNGVGGANNYTYHICLVGNGSFTAEQEKSWDERVAVNMKRLNVKVADVKGHGEMPGANTSCPGIAMTKVRARITNGAVGGEQVVNKPTPSPAKPAPSTGGNGGGSIVNWMNAQGMDSSYSNRAKLASQHGISNYSGTAAQNTQLLGFLQSSPKPAPKPKPSGNQTTGSIVTYLNSIGADSSYGARAKLAQANGIRNYSGTAAQNTQLLGILRGSNAKPAAPSRPKARAGEGIVNYMNRLGMDSSYSNRAKLAAQNGITGYRGTAAQNTKLLQIISG